MLDAVIDTPRRASNRYDAPMLQPPSFSRRGALAARLARCSTWAALAAVTWLAASPAALAQDIADGALLVASSKLDDANFSRTVVLVLRHDDNGTVGVVINRPTNLVPATLFPEIAATVGTYDGRLYRGGPVAPGRLLFLVRGLAAATVNGPEVLDKVFLSADPESLTDITRLAEGVNDLRMYAGHAEWTQGQLDQEIAAGGWTVVPGDADLVFSAEPWQLWEALSTRPGGGVVAGAATLDQPFAALRERGSLSRSALR
jgi:putative transcriptional regulator